MRSIQVRQFGLPEVLQLVEQAEPQAGAGQVVIAVEAAGVSFGDTSVRAGKYPFPLPFVPGWEVGGRVIEVGAGGDSALLGKPVVARTASGGGYSERVLAEASNVFPLPENLAVEQALGVLLAGGTAISLLKIARVAPGETVLITAASGNTGSQLIQLAKAAGAGMVIGAAGGAEKLAVVSRLGADVIVDYSQEGWVEQILNATEGKGVDVAIDAVGGTLGRQVFALVADGHGRLAVYGSSSGVEATIGLGELAMRGVTAIGALGLAMARTEQELLADMQTALREAAAGRLLAVTEQRFPLEQAARAHELIEARKHVGKVLLIP
ncbi:quinone oxidoreductase family protein [Ktedonosporobacter rubrisoli]|nr:zinc-binding dehydrogenase [Ktedonosporobacter rubrisoli]